MTGGAAGLGPVTTLDELWRDMTRQVYDKHPTTPKEMTDRRRAFYAGAASMLKLFELASAAENPDVFCDRMAVAYAEIERFMLALPGAD